jgi:hypothetical protein
MSLIIRLKQTSPDYWNYHISCRLIFDFDWHCNCNCNCNFIDFNSLNPPNRFLFAYIQRNVAMDHHTNMCLKPRNAWY